MKNFLIVALSIIALFGTSCSITAGQTLNKGTATNNVTLELDYQEVIHIDCNSNVVSDDKNQVVAPPRAPVSIYPANPLTVGGSLFFNTSTGSTAPLVSSYTDFIVDHGDGALSMHVITGGNIINYTFYSCDLRNANGSCNNDNSQTIQEQGQLLLMVTYIEKTITTPQIISDCATPAPTPASSPALLRKN
jgi:hypothetical protein